MLNFDFNRKTDSPPKVESIKKKHPRNMHQVKKRCHCSLPWINRMLFPDQDTVSEHSALFSPQKDIIISL